MNCRRQKKVNLALLVSPQSFLYYEKMAQSTELKDDRMEKHRSLFVFISE